MLLRTFCAGLLLLGFLSVSSLAEDKLPAAKEILARSVKQQGGKKAFEKIKSYTMKGKVEIPGITGEMLINFAAPDKVSVVVDLEGLGQQRQGVNGGVAWEIPPGQPARLMKKDEAQRFLQEIDMTTAYKPESVYKTMKTVAVEQVGEAKCYKVEMTRPGADNKDVGFFSVENGLLIKSITTRPSALGPLKIVTDVKEYKKFGETMSPVLMEQTLEAIGMTQTVSIKSVEHNKKIPASEFAIPDEVQELIKSSEK